MKSVNLIECVLALTVNQLFRKLFSNFCFFRKNLINIKKAEAKKKKKIQN